MCFSQIVSPGNRVWDGKAAAVSWRGGTMWGIVFAALLFSTPVWAAHFDFDVVYLGNDLTELAPESNEPIGTSLVPSDTFQWTLTSADDRFWLVETAGNFFPLAGLQVNEQGDRIGDFDLVLRNDGLDVFELSETGALNSKVHIGTNTVALPEGLAFDEMSLFYTLVSAVTVPLDDDEGDGGGGGAFFPEDVSTTLRSRVPIFGAPENNQFSPGIVYSVPEPSALMLAGAGCLALMRRRMKSR
ncbi:MAG: PEP-CTERM sorting domain-containing protein [Algisphaera sp.]